jgi:hypothetical protein
VATAGTNGSIAPSGTSLYTLNATPTYAFTANAHYHVDDVLVDGGSVGAVPSYTFAPLAANHTVAVSFALNPPVAAITAFSAQQVKSGNDASGTTKVTLSWPALGAGQTVQVYRAGYGNYPEYDDAPNAGMVPSAPTYPPSAPWTLTAVTASGTTDQPTTRDFWYYVAFVTDQYGTVSPVSNVASGVLNYHLGDVTDGHTDGQGNNIVDIADVSLLGSHYGLTGAAVTAFNYLDVGPTTNRSVDGRPMTDNQIDFEDLVVFAMNYLVPSMPQTAVRPTQVAVESDELLLDVPNAYTQGHITARLQLRGTGAVQALSARLTWDPAVVAIESSAPGTLADDLGAVMLSATPGTIDVARLGVRDHGLVGEGDVAAVTFRRLAAGDPKIQLVAVDARGPANDHVALAFRNVSVKVLPTVTSFDRIAPNPFRSNAILSFALAKGGPVQLAIYSVDGRRVRQLVAGAREAGVYQVAWDGRDEGGSAVPAGVYYARLMTPQGNFTHQMVYLK